MRTGLAPILLLTVLAACDRPPAREPGRPEAASTAAVQLTEDQAFRLAFGAPAPATRTGVRPEAPDETLTYRPAGLQPLGDGLVLVSLATSGSDCHVCTGAVAVHYLKPRAAGWAVTSASPELLTGRGFGEPPDWSIRRDLGSSPMLVTEAGYTGQGYTCTTSDLVELTPAGPVLRGEAIVVHQDDAGAVGPEHATVSRGKLGMRPDGTLRVDFGARGSVDYELRQGRYVAVAGPQALREC